MTDIAELFARDPLNCTRDDIVAIIAEFRSRRHQFNAPKAPSSKAPKVAAKRLSLSESLAASIDTSDADF